MQALSRLKNAWFRARSPEPSDSVTSPSRADTIVALIIVSAYAILQIALVVAHDPWVDEAQAWLLATGATNPLDLLILPGEGHPPLWHWLLKALSGVFDFGQARYLNTGIAILNAVLLCRLLRGEVILLALILFSFAVLHYWGYHFRPYALVFTCLLTALWLDRSGRSLAATWVLAIACGLHFFSGLFFAFWLVFQHGKGTRIVDLLAPSLLALFFGAIAVLSGLGNPTTGPQTGDLLVDTLHNLSWAVMLETWRGPLVAVLTVAALTFAFHTQKALLVALLGLLICFSLAAAVIYGRSPWHAAFMTMLCFLATMTAGITPVRRWVLILLLVPQVAIGLALVGQRLANPVWTKDDLYAIVARDAGPDFNPELDLVGWPDMAIPEWAAKNDIRMINANSGETADAIKWRTHSPMVYADSVLNKPKPYWLICIKCDQVVGYLERSGSTAVQLGYKTSFDFEAATAFRIE
ncbi:hypothetical protein NIM87_08110 [Devosia sp. XJ19-1]|uniref:Uncharacterized protein n=1 Tax=Devosia ureilytica TaxID=2952754 RepID=A0A9Q4ANY2_9HYPH|nr:hypothetical protein [Devosia ureilytica]MCP8883458.1 hypothetical protein [Devosia ureilytica]MCP8887066.1 hypothetical protein [Devosia ureilytica]